MYNIICTIYIAHVISTSYIQCTSIQSYAHELYIVSTYTKLLSMYMYIEILIAAI